MNIPLIQIIICLVIGIALIILLSTRYRVHAFFALLIASLVSGVGLGMPVNEVLSTMKEGFGHIMKSLGFIIVLGTALGILLEHTGSTQVMANYILKRVGEQNASLAISITGLIVGLPLFCDSGYIVLNGLNKSLASRSGKGIVVMSISLASGLYSVHCLIPPHPGAAAAAVTIGVDYGKLILFGLLVAIPTMLVGHYWAWYAGRNIQIADNQSVIENKESSLKLPSTFNSFLPVIVPIILIASKSFLDKSEWAKNVWLNNLLMLGDPVIALLIGILLALSCKRGWTSATLSQLMQESVEKAGGILIIIEAGGAFGAILTASKIGEQVSNTLTLSSLGILFPFLITCLLKTAQGSSTVAIITATSIIQPLLPALGLDSESGKLWTVLAMGAGSMMISHTNDAYFWVIANFSGIELKTMLKIYSTASILMGLVAFLMVYFLSILIS